MNGYLCTFITCINQNNILKLVCKSAADICRFDFIQSITCQVAVFRCSGIKRITIIATGILTIRSNCLSAFFILIMDGYRFAFVACVIQINILMFGRKFTLQIFRVFFIKSIFFIQIVRKHSIIGIFVTIISDIKRIINIAIRKCYIISNRIIRMRLIHIMNCYGSGFFFLII